VFKRRAAEVEKLFAGTGHRVVVNASKPRKGAFVVRIGSDEDGSDAKACIELLALPRPFTKLRELDLEEALSAHLK
jgi:hypothetical protein